MMYSFVQWRVCGILFQIPDMNKATVSFEPSFSAVVKTIHDIIDHMLSSVQGFRCVEHHLFVEDEGIKMRHISSVQLSEERILWAKQRVVDVVEKNSLGPLKYEH